MSTSTVYGSSSPMLEAALRCVNIVLSSPGAPFNGLATAASRKPKCVEYDP